MKKEVLDKFVSHLNEGLLEKVNQAVSEKLGAEIKFEIKIHEMYNDFTITLEERGEEITKQLTATPLLKSMFKNANLWSQAWFNENNGEASFSIHIAYDHTRGGSNGLTLLDLLFNKNNEEFRC